MTPDEHTSYISQLEFLINTAHKEFERINTTVYANQLQLIKHDLWVSVTLLSALFLFFTKCYDLDSDKQFFLSNLVSSPFHILISILFFSTMTCLAIVFFLGIDTLRGRENLVSILGKTLHDHKDYILKGNANEKNMPFYDDLLDAYTAVLEVAHKKTARIAKRHRKISHLLTTSFALFCATILMGLLDRAEDVSFNFIFWFLISILTLPFWLKKV